jgi:hypothetical protein
MQQFLDEKLSKQTTSTLPDKPVEEKQDTIPGGKETLLDVPNRKPLPPYVRSAGRPCVLQDIVMHAPDLYAEFITYIQAGAYYNVAAEAIGVCEGTLRNWLIRGKADLGGSLDTWYSRLFRDIRRAVALARVGAEASIREASPSRWLSHGPGKMFGEQWTEQKGPTIRSDSDSEPNRQIESNTIDGVVVLTTDPTSTEEQKLLEQQQQDKQTNQSDKRNEENSILHVDPAKELATIEAMEASGLATYSEAHKDALRRQIQTTND